MLSPPVRMAIDYNRGLPAPVRFTHVLIAAAAQTLRPILKWTFAPRTRDWAPALVIGLPLAVLLWPFDGPLSGLLSWFGKQLSGDFRRELEAWQQFGAFGSLLFTVAAVWLLDRRRWRRLLDLGLATGLAAIACSIGKVLVGRPRPRSGDPWTILGPFGEYPMVGEDGARWLARAWPWPERTGAVVPGGTDLWSMPSSHTVFAVMLSVFLATVYPKLRPLAIFLALLVGFSRVLVGAHWPTDVIVGASLGYVIGAMVISRWWGVRTLDWLWRTAIDRTARPAFPALAAEERLISGR